MSDRLAAPPPPPTGSMPPAAPPAGHATAVAFEFERRGARHALPVAAVRQVVVDPAVTRVPGAPHALLGLVAFRGAVVPLLEPPVVDPDATEAPGARVVAAVVADGAAGLIALAADAVHGFTGAHRADALLDPAALELRVRGEAARRASTVPPPEEPRDG